MSTEERTAKFSQVGADVKNMNLFSRTFLSLQDKGLRRTFQSVASIVEDVFFEFRYGVKTLQEKTLDELEIDGENLDDSEDYMATRGRPFCKLIESLDLPRDSVFVDLGSGMGKVLMLTAGYSFAEIKGIEFSKELCEIAEKNLTSFKKRSGKGENVEIIHTDAAKYEMTGGENVFFLYNSFHKIVLQKVLQNLKASLEERPRKVWLLYSNAKDAAFVESDGLFRKERRFTYGGSDFDIFTTESN